MTQCPPFCSGIDRSGVPRPPPTTTAERSVQSAERKRRLAASSGLRGRATTTRSLKRERTRECRVGASPV